MLFALAIGNVDRAREMTATFEAIDDEARDILVRPLVENDEAAGIHQEILAARDAALAQSASKGCGGAPPGGQRRFAR